MASISPSASADSKPASISICALDTWKSPQARRTSMLPVDILPATVACSVDVSRKSSRIWDNADAFSAAASEVMSSGFSDSISSGKGIYRTGPSVSGSGNFAKRSNLPTKYSKRESGMMLRPSSLKIQGRAAVESCLAIKRGSRRESSLSSAAVIRKKPASLSCLCLKTRNQPKSLRPSVWLLFTPKSVRSSASLVIVSY